MKLPYIYNVLKWMPLRIILASGRVKMLAQVHVILCLWPQSILKLAEKLKYDKNEEFLDKLMSLGRAVHVDVRESCA